MHATQPQNSTAIKAGWLLLVVGFFVALIPGLGLSMMLLSFPFCLAAFVLGIVGAAKNQPVRGVFLIVGSLVAFVIFWILPWISSLIYGAAMSPPK